MPKASPHGPQSPVRLNKWLADCGICSRREADKLIAEGFVKVNGRVVTKMGTQITPGKDAVVANGTACTPPTKFLYAVLHKRPGLITTRSDERARKTIYEDIPEQWQVVKPAGRLDRQTSGLLLLSNDGEWLNRLMHPRFHVPKRYAITVEQLLNEQQLTQLSEGVTLQPENKLAVMKNIEWIDATTFHATLGTGYNRQIRRSIELVGNNVVKLKRLSVGPVHLGKLKPGECRLLNARERGLLAKLLGLASSLKSASNTLFEKSRTVAGKPASRKFQAKARPNRQKPPVH